jgi:hypothetical protein
VRTLGCDFDNVYTQDEDSLLNRKHTTCVLSFFHDNVYMLLEANKLVRPL